MDIFFIEGSPATFATNGEGKWKEILRKSIPSNNPSQNWQGVVLTFHLKSLTHNNQPFDIDNLVEPVFSVLVGRKGYFEGKRPNIRWWYAKRMQTNPEGVEIKLSAAGQYQTPLRASINWLKKFYLAIKIAKEIPGGYHTIFEDTYSGKLPGSAKSSELPSWLYQHTGKISLRQDDRFSVYLGFSEDLNIADISTGIVKHVIDCLYPLLGGEPGKPEDWKIDELFVEKI